MRTQIYQYAVFFWGPMMNQILFGFSMKWVLERRNYVTHSGTNYLGVDSSELLYYLQSEKMS